MSDQTYAQMATSSYSIASSYMIPSTSSYTTVSDIPPSTYIQNNEATLAESTPPIQPMPIEQVPESHQAPPENPASYVSPTIEAQPPNNSQSNSSASNNAHTLSVAPVDNITNSQEEQGAEEEVAVLEAERPCNRTTEDHPNGETQSQ